MPNKLAQENSPYLLQHKDNPVDWYPWGEEALNRSKDENKPIFLSIGYAACHWCHVMEHESFEDPDTAALMNQHFINIKVDREERPDLDSIYMDAVVALTGRGGWPMSVFLIPDGKPFFGGTYFPPEDRYNMPSFKKVLLSIAQLWQNDQNSILDSSDKIFAHLQKNILPPTNQKVLDPDTLINASENIAKTYDWDNGGWGQAPKFPQPMAIRFLLQLAAQGDQEALNIAVHALKMMAKGGMYDIVGGGFARYSVDNYWLVPHFEKMLYDNAQLARAYLHAYLITKEDIYKQITEKTLDFLIREMRHPAGGFFSSLDADSEGEEGKFYVWSIEEITSILENEADLDLFITAYDITNEGNFEGQTVLQRARSNEELASKFDLTLEQLKTKLKEFNEILYTARSKRVRPPTDDKVLTSWNALTLTAFAEAARYLDRNDYLQIAQQNADFILEELHPQEHLLRTWRNNKASHNAYLEDYAALILGLLSLYQSDFDTRWFQSAQNLTNDMLEYFIDPAGGFFDTRSDHEQLISRPKDQQDNAIPCGNSMAAEALLQMAAFTGNTQWLDTADQTLSSLQPYLAQHPTAFSNWLSALNFSLAENQEIAVIGSLETQETQDLLALIRQELRPHAVIASSMPNPPEGSPPLLENRPMTDNKLTVYICKDFICECPVTAPKDLEKLLST